MSDFNQMTGRQIAAARALLGIGQVELASLARISAPTLRRMEASEGQPNGMANNLAAVRAALESAGITFLDGAYSGAGGPGVRLTAPVTSTADSDDSEVVQYPEYKDKGGVGGSGG